jgi:hypothetical protein
MPIKLSDLLEGSLENLDQIERELVRRLHQLVGQPDNEATRTQMAAAIQQLFGLLPLQFDKRTCEDYLSDEAPASAAWASQVTALRVQQAFLYEDLRDLRQQLERGPAAAVLPTVKPLLRDWLQRLAQHEQEERRLSQLAINLDLSR